MEAVFNEDLMGFPVYVRSDRHPAFLKLKEDFESHGTTMIQTVGYRATSNGICERAHQILKCKLATMREDSSSLPLKLAQIAAVHNRTPGANGIPAEVMAGRRIRSAIEWREEAPVTDGSPFKRSQRVFVKKLNPRAGQKFEEGVFTVIESNPFSTKVARNGVILTVATDRVASCCNSEL